jgi:hypothetical protein
MAGRVAPALLACCVLCGCPKPGADGVADAGPALDAAPAVSSPGSSSPTVMLVAVDASTPLMQITSGIKSRKDPAYPGLPLFEKLAVERSDRPADALSTDKVFDGLVSKGMKVASRRQVLAGIVGAGFCQKGDVDPDLDVTVCEYDDDASLEKGKKTMLSVPYPRREIVSWKKSTISIGRLSEGKATADAAKKIAAYVVTL